MTTNTTFYRTKQRDLILNCLMKNKERHLTADDIIEELSKDKTAVGRTTVYRHLDKLVNQHIIRKYILEEGTSACYQYIDQDAQCHEHFHLKCVDCGELIHIECGYLEELSNHVATDHKFTIDTSKIMLYGLCANCKKAR